MNRPNPDELLAQVTAAEVRQSRGQLRIFFGYAAGVGKTYAMLETAKRTLAAGHDVVIGYVEPHARPATQALVAGFEVIPVLQVSINGVTLNEFDVDRAISRHPEIILVDELAHSNASGCRHQKRWQDVEELLELGIHVWTTLNVQHIESLNDIIGQITGVVVRETVPDRVFHSASHVELIDITPEELLERLHAGAIYQPEQARRAIQNFFQQSNLAALRELSLRQTAQRIHTDVENARSQRTRETPWATAERLLVCVGPSPTTARVIRTAKRLADALDAPWIAVAVDLHGRPLPGQVTQHLQLAERLGGETTIIPGQRISTSVLELARDRNVTKILIGKTNQPRWKRLFIGSVVDEMLEQSGDIDLYVIRGDDDSKPVPKQAPVKNKIDWPCYGQAIFLVILAGWLAHALRWLKIADAEANTVMIFLAGIAWSAFRYGRGPAMVSSLLAVCLFDFFFVPPYWSFAVSDTQYGVTFGVMFAIGIIISSLTARLKSQVERTRERERRTAALYQLSKQLSGIDGRVFLLTAAGQKIAELFRAEVAIYLAHGQRPPQINFGQRTSIAQHAVSVSVADWVMKHDQPAGRGTDTLPNAVGLFMPLIGSHSTIGAIAIGRDDVARLLEPDQRQFIEAITGLLALALERDQSTLDAATARIETEAEQVRNSLLSSVSHDLRTPLAVITGSASSLLDVPTLDDAQRRELLQTIAAETQRLHRLLENILQMTKLEAGQGLPNQQWHVPEELIGSALTRVQPLLQQHPLRVDVAADLPLISVDGILIEQVLLNLLENAVRYTPPGTAIAILAQRDGAWLRLAVQDNGPGIPVGMEEKIFEKFYRATPRSDDGRGSGLGLAICRAIITAHRGTITAQNRPTGGAEFVIRLPLANDSPKVTVS